MFGDHVRNLFKAKADEHGLISSTGVEEIIKFNLNYTFARQFLTELTKNQLVKGVEVATKGGIRTKYSYESLIDVLEFLLVTETLPGLLRGNVKDNRVKIAQEGKLKSQVENTKIEELVVHAYHDEPGDFSCDLEFQSACNVAYYFFHNWLCDTKNPNFDFYRDWPKFRDKVVADTTSEFRLDIPFFNKHFRSKSWVGHEINDVKSTRSLTADGNRADLRDSIYELDRFLEERSIEEQQKMLITWMEVILVFENGSQWVTNEAKAALKKHAPKLEQKWLIDDWWVLSFIYLGMNGNYKNNHSR